MSRIGVGRGIDFREWGGVARTGNTGRGWVMQMEKKRGERGREGGSIGHKGQEKELVGKEERRDE